MSNQNGWLPGQPAHAEIWPDNPQLVALPVEQKKALLEALGMEGEVARLSLRHQFPLGYYKLTSSSDRAFLKVVRNDTLHRQLDANELSNWLKSQGLAASVMRSGFPRPLGKDCSILAYDFIEARYGNPDDGDIVSLARGLARVHAALRTSPQAGKVRIEAEKREACLGRWRNRALAGEPLPGPSSEATSAGLSRMPSVPDRQGASQIVHGDLNRGNVLFGQDAASPVVIIDFESALSTWASPVVDVANVAQRFILAAIADKARAGRLIELLLSSYAEQSAPQNGSLTAGRLRDCLRWMAGRNLALLCEKETESGGVDDAEWQKQQQLMSISESWIQTSQSPLRSGFADKKENSLR